MRELILEALKREPTVSGEQLGKRLNISRTAVWKHVNELRKDGYKIYSSPQKGYSLVETTDLLLPEEIKAGLETRILGTRILHYTEVTSTQDLAAALAREGAGEGIAIIAEEQTHGRGRKGRQWVSPREGGIYISIVLRPDLKPFQTIQIPLVAGIALCRAIQMVTPALPRIKWPNDIVIDGKKVAGILTEISAEVDAVNYVVLGVGINVNTPAPILEGISGGIAGSLAETAGKSLSRVRVVQHFINEFDRAYSTFLGDGFRALRQDWKNLNITVCSRVVISNGGEEITGTAVDIDEDGFLLVEGENGLVARVVSGDVLAVNPN
ncbi:MAG: biotin--[acetyl-CoA-carboxylase] ligase [Dehalococcoidales bacterium]|nr:biotin--[acetyl-CoA-carboxylase] ligase [Dehalococcoidales bacterium]